MTDQRNEERLKGGNISNVYRLGDTVRRELKPGSAKIHRLLKHLEEKGFGYAPRFLGIDEKGREILSFIEGEAGNDPLKEYMCSDEVLKEIAKMLRLYHDAIRDFPITDDWEPIDLTPNKMEVICHNDFARYNIVFHQERPVGIIDFDVAGPGPRLWDIAYTLYTCVPLSRLHLSEKGEEIHYDPFRDVGRRKQRVRLFFESYGEELNEAYIEMVLLRLEGLCQTIVRKADEGDMAFLKMIEEGHLEHYRADITFICKYGGEWM